MSYIKSGVGSCVCSMAVLFEALKVTGLVLVFRVTKVGGSSAGKLRVTVLSRCSVGA